MCVESERETASHLSDNHTLTRFCRLTVEIEWIATLQGFQIMFLLQFYIHSLPNPEDLQSPMSVIYAWQIHSGPHLTQEWHCGLSRLRRITFCFLWVSGAGPLRGTDRPRPLPALEAPGHNKHRKWWYAKKKNKTIISSKIEWSIIWIFFLSEQMLF